MGKARRKGPVGRQKSSQKKAIQPSEIAPKFEKATDNQFQDALAKKDFAKAKKILDSLINFKNVNIFFILLFINVLFFSVICYIIKS